MDIEVEAEELKRIVQEAFSRVHRDYLEKKIVHRTIDASVKYFVKTGRLPTVRQVWTWFHLMESVKPEPVHRPLSGEHRGVVIG